MELKRLVLLTLAIFFIFIVVEILFLQEDHRNLQNDSNIDEENSFEINRIVIRMM